MGSKDLLSTRDAAARVGVHERTLRRYIACGHIAHRRLPGGHYRISEDAIDAFLDCAEGPAHVESGRPSVRPEPRRTRPQGQRHAQREYDLSSAHLARLRAQAAGRTGGAR